MRLSSYVLLAGVLLAGPLAATSGAISPVGTISENQDYVDLAGSEDQFLAVGLVSVPGAACTGAWLGGEYVLTARHCGGGPDNITFTFDNGTSVGSVGHWASEVPANANDLAIVRLAETPNLPANYRPLKVRANNNGVPGKTGTLVGYGGIGRSAGHNNITVADNTGEINAVRSAAASLPLGANLIPGDSGGPLLVQENDGDFSIVGVAAVIFGNFDVWSNPTAYSEQIDFGMKYNHWSFFQDGSTPPLAGDLTLDGEVDFEDVEAFVAGWRMEHPVIDLTAWTKGDLNGDGITSLPDWALLREAHFDLHGSQLAVPDHLFGAPEPSSLLLALAGFAVLLNRRTKP